MSFLSHIGDYWQASSALQGAIPYDKLYLGIMPASFTLDDCPFVVVQPTGSTPTFLTGSAYFEEFLFNFNIYHTDSDALESVAQTVMDNFDYKTISSETISCIRQSGAYQVVKTETPASVFQMVIGYALTENRSMP